MKRKLLPIICVFTLTASATAWADQSTTARPSTPAAVMSASPASAMPYNGVTTTTTSTPQNRTTAMPSSQSTMTPTTRTTASPSTPSTMTPGNQSTTTSDNRSTATPSSHSTTTSDNRSTATPSNQSTTTSDNRSTATPSTQATMMPDDRASATPGVSADQVTFYVEGSNYSLQIPREIKDMVRMSTAQEASNYDKLFVVDSDAPLQTIQPNAFKQVNFISGSDEYELFTIYTYNTSQYEQQVKNNGFYTLKVLNQTADTTDVLAIPTVSPIKSGEAFADEYTLALQAVNMFQPTGTENVAMTTSTPSMQTAAPTTMPTDNAAYLTYDRVKTINGDKFVPVREVLEKLGYTVSWDAKTKGISVTKGNIYKSISTRRIIGTNPQSTNAIAGSCAVIENDIAYMPLPYFKDVLGLNIEDDVNESISFK